jgi:glycosyltransferase involved in cell wall biosynthesis
MIEPFEGVCIVNDTKNGAVTVLIPAHNEEKSVGTAVRRVKELHPDFDMLVVDDGSTDKTMRVAM